MLISLPVCLGLALGGLAGAASPARADEEVYYLYNDHLGTPVKATDEAGAGVWAAQARPFGEATPSLQALPVNLRFPGQYHDGETGLHYNYQRT